MDKRKIILDVDTGSDDAIAIMLAIKSEAFEILGICAVTGNRGIEYTTENTLRVVEYLNSDVKVYRGARLPMTSTLIPYRRDDIPFEGEKDVEVAVHDSYLDLPESKERTLEEISATEFYLQSLRNASEKITIITVGPLTNLALALRADERIVDSIEEIIVMGGGYRLTNRTAGAEFNFWVDPEAAQIVLNCGAKILMVPLDATHEAAVSSEFAKRLKSYDTKAGNYVADLIESRRRGYNAWQPMEDENTVPIHDALAVAALLDESVLKNVKSARVDVNTSMGISDGSCVVDMDYKDKSKEHNVRLATGANVKAFEELLEDIFKK